MIRRLLPLIAALMLTACGSPGTGTAPMFIPCRATRFGDVVWSPDGKHIAFQATTVSDITMTYVMNPDGSAIRKHYSSIRWIPNLQWLPDSQTLAYTNDHHTFITSSLDGSLSEFSFPANTFINARFSPDGRTIAYDRFPYHGDYAPSQVGIYRIDRDGGGLVRLSKGRDALEQWSPDGTHIAFVRDDGQRSFVATMRSDGGDQRLLAEGAGPVYWSPDGQWLSYISFYDDGFGIYIVSADGAVSKLVTKDVSFVIHSWLADSRHISFGSSSPDYFLNIVDIDTLSVETLSTVHLAFASPTAWSPDGKQVVFIGYDHIASPPADLEELFVANRDGTGLTHLTDNPGRYKCFNWPF